MTVNDEREVVHLVDEQEESKEIKGVPPGHVFKTLSIAEQLKRDLWQRVEGYIKTEPIQYWIDFPTAPLPTPFVRSSPFFVVDKRTLGKLEHFREALISQTRWGKLYYNGDKLTIYDEDILLGIIGMISLLKKDKERQRKAVPSQSYTGSINPVANLMGLKNPRAHYAQLIRSLDKLHEAKFKLVMRKEGSFIDTPRFRIIEKLYTRERVTKTGKKIGLIIHVELDPWFYSLIMGHGHEITFLDVRLRASLKGSVAKALYRFIKSQKEFTPHYKTLAQIINLNLSKSDRQLKKDIRRAITELKQKGVLTQDSRIEPSGRAYLKRELSRSRLKQVEGLKQKRIPAPPTPAPLAEPVREMAGILAKAKEIPEASRSRARNQRAFELREEAKRIAEARGGDWRKIFDDLIEKEWSSQK